MNMDKIKIQVTEGCTSYSCLINDVEFVDMDEKETRELCKKIVDKCQTGQLQSIIWDFAILEGEHTDLGVCDQCGDRVDRYTVEL